MGGRIVSNLLLSLDEGRMLSMVGWLGIVDGMLWKTLLMLLPKMRCCRESDGVAHCRWAVESFGDAIELPNKSKGFAVSTDIDKEEMVFGCGGHAKGHCNVAVCDMMEWENGSNVEATRPSESDVLSSLTWSMVMDPAGGL